MLIEKLNFQKMFVWPKRLIRKSDDHPDFKQTHAGDNIH